MPLSPQQIQANLRALESQRSDREEKQEAFDALRQEFAPAIHMTSEYGQELARVFALRFPLWSAPPSKAIQNHPAVLADRIRGLVVGAALGDATGLSTEFLSRAEVALSYPPDHLYHPLAAVVPDLHRINFPAGDWTDDTDQLILILQTLLEHEGRFHGPTMALKLLDWKDGGFSGLGDQSGAGLGRTTLAVMHHGLFKTDPQAAAAAIWEQGGRDLAPNGGVMRTAITGVPFFWDAQVVRQNTLGFCRTTHADPRCAASCLVAADCVRQLLVIVSQTSRSDGSTIVSHATVEEIIQSAVEAGIAGAEGLNEQGVAELRSHAAASAIEELKLDEANKIGYTYKCMGCGMWALRQGSKLLEQGMEPQVMVRNVLQDVVRSGGDADTNGAVAGALLGLLVGYQALPWTHELPYGGWLEAWIQKLLFMLKLPVTQHERRSLGSLVI